MIHPGKRRNVREPGDSLRPHLVSAVESALVSHWRPLSELGHAYAYLDANARHYVANLSIDAIAAELYERGYVIAPKDSDR